MVPGNLCANFPEVSVFNWAMSSRECVDSIHDVNYDCEDTRLGVRSFIYHTTVTLVTG